MWVFSQQGFVSIVRNRNDHRYMLLRAREKADLMHFAELAREAGVPFGEVEDTPWADYAYRVELKENHARLLIMHAVKNIEYDNFKASVHGEPERDAAYMRIWRAMYDFQERRRLGNLDEDEDAGTPLFKPISMRPDDNFL